MIFHPKTDKLLQAFIKNPSSPVIFQTSSLIDATSFVEYLSSIFLTGSDKQDIIITGMDEVEPYSIDRLREFKKSLKLLPVSSSKVARIAIIYNADRFSEESQNTLLKLLEEPPKKTLIVLHMSDKQKILDTIQSRCVYITLLPITLKQATSKASDLGITDITYIKRIYALSAGQSQKYLLMLADNTNTEYIQSVKIFLSFTTFEKLNNYEQYDTKDKLIELCQMLELISAASMHTSQISTIERWKSIAVASRRTRSNINSNVLLKLAYLQLCVSI